MDSAARASETCQLQPRLHIRPRHQRVDDDTPPFFVRFTPDGKSFELFTPTTRESYAALVPVTTG